MASPDDTLFQIMEQNKQVDIYGQQLIQQAAETQAKKKVAKSVGEISNPDVIQGEIDVASEGSFSPKRITQIDPKAFAAGTFGNFEIRTDQEGNRYAIESPPKPQVSVKKELQNQITKSSASDLMTQLDLLGKLEGPARVERSMVVFQNIEEAKSKRLGELQQIAYSRSGYDEAQKNLQTVRNMEQLTGFTQRKPGKLSTEQKEAQLLLGQTQNIGNDLLKNLALSDPEYQKLVAMGKRLEVSENAALRAEGKKEAEKHEMGWITPTTITAFRLMYDFTGTDDEAKSTIYAKSSKDKTFAALMQIERNNSLDYLSHKDKAIRDKAAKFIIGSMNELAGRPRDDMKSLEAQVIRQIANDRTVVLDKAAREAITLGTPTTQEKLEQYDSRIRAGVEARLLDTYERKLGNLSSWTITNPEIQKVVSDLALASKNDRVEFKDVVKNYVGLTMGAERQLKVESLQRELAAQTAKDKTNDFLPIDYSTSLVKFNNALKLEADRNAAAIIVNRVTESMKPLTQGPSIGGVGISPFGITFTNRKE